MATLKMGSTTVLTDTTLANGVQDNITRLGTVTTGTVSNTVTGDGLAFKKIGSATFSTTSTIDLGQDLGSYRIHKLYVAVKPNSTGGAGNVEMRVKIGDAWLSSADYSYNYIGMRSNSINPVVGWANDANTFFKLTPDSSRADSRTYMEITFHDATKTEETGIQCNVMGYNHDGAKRLLSTTNYCKVKNTGVVQDIRIYPTNYPLTGQWELYGIV